jgi:UDP-GlcNAc3NAcA epimerase
LLRAAWAPFAWNCTYQRTWSTADSALLSSFGILLRPIPRKMRVLTVIGNRPQFVKAAAVSARLREAAAEVLVHTGQHYDPELSQVFFDELELPPPEHLLDLGGGSNTAQTGRMLGALEPLLAAERPDVVLVYGDTNSTLAGALAAAQARIPVAHVEAGMRSFDRSMPEELNRVLADHASDLLLCSSAAPAEQLRREGVSGEVVVVGDVMVDVAQLLAPRARERTAVLEACEVEPGGYLLATAHRAGTVDDPALLERLVALLTGMPDPVVLPLHPRTRMRLEAAGLLSELEAAPGVRLVAPLGYLDFTALLLNARAVLTDSGGVQKEAYLAGVPCVTLRERTEWTETVEAGWNVLVGLDADAARAALEGERPVERPPLYGDGRAGERVVQALVALRERVAVA